MLSGADSGWQDDAPDAGVATLRYHDRAFSHDAIKILPGEYHVTTSDLVLVTLLGSCVSACLRDSLAGVGGMNHFMLPEGERAVGGSASARYGAFAMEVLINELLKRGARRSNIEAKVFGGGNVLRGMTVSNVGARNAEFVLRYLADERIAVVAQDLGGSDARKLGYFAKSGRVLLRRIPMAASAPALVAESEYRKRLQVQPVAGDIELFD